MTFIHADHYQDAYLYAVRNKISEWVFLQGPEDLARAKDFHLIALTPLSKGVDYVLHHARACGGKITVTYP